MKVITEKDVEDLKDREKLVNELEKVFRSYVSGKTRMPSKVYMDTPNGDFRSMPAQVVTSDWKAAGQKWVSVYPDNPENYDMNTVIATVILNSLETSERLATIEANNLTGWRTGSVAALATKHLSPEDSSTLGLVGLGKQAHHQLENINTVRDIESVIAVDKDDTVKEEFKNTFDEKYDVETYDDTSVLSSCDIVSTVTPVRDPIVSKEDVENVSHINAMGADAKGKQELESSITSNSTIIVDDYKQTKHSGEINIPLSEDIISEEDVLCSLGEYINEEENTKNERTIFDSTGLAIQDITAAWIIYNNYVSRPQN